MIRALVVVVWLVGTTSAWAQEVVSPPGLRPDALSTAFIRDDRGVETAGKLLRLDDKSVVMIVEGRQREFDLAHVWSVQKRGDSLKNGALIGATVGALLGILSGSMAECRSGSHYGGCDLGVRLWFAAASTAFYSSVGVGIDALVPGRTTLYQRPVPTVGFDRTPRGPGVRVSVRW